MKYIRTKDYIYDIKANYIELEQDEKTSELVAYFSPNEKIRLSCRMPIISQADTIEELCEIFVIDFGEIKHFCYNFRQINNYAEYKNVYGGILLNEWGLKYVAKMNEKGELELLWD